MVLRLARVISTCRLLPLSVRIFAPLHCGNHSPQRLKSAMISKRRSLGASIWNTDLVKWLSSSFVDRGQFVLLAQEPDLQALVGLDDLEKLAPAAFALHLRSEGIDSAIQGLHK